MFVSDHVRRLLRGLRLGLSSDATVDVAFVCADGLVVPAHRAVVSAFSAFLSKALLSSGESAALTTVAHLPDFTANVVARLLELAYTGDCAVEADEEAAELAELLALVGVDWAVDVGNRNRTGLFRSGSTVSASVPDKLGEDASMNVDDNDDDDDCDAFIEMVIVEENPTNILDIKLTNTDTCKPAFTKANNKECIQKIIHDSSSSLDTSSSILDESVPSKSLNSTKISSPTLDKSTASKIVNIESSGHPNKDPNNSKPNKTATSTGLSGTSVNNSIVDQPFKPDILNYVKLNSGNINHTVSKPVVSGIKTAARENANGSSRLSCSPRSNGTLENAVIKVANEKVVNRSGCSGDDAGSNKTVVSSSRLSSSPGSNSSLENTVPSFLKVANVKSLSGVDAGNPGRSRPTPYDRPKTYRNNRYSTLTCPLPTCGEAFDMKASMRGHFVKHFSEEIRELGGFDETETKCPKCRAELSHNHELVVHVALQHRVIAEVVQDQGMLSKIDIKK